MARLGRKYVTLFELASVPGSDPVPTDEWASRVLRLMISANWADPSFLEELSESALIGTMCRVLPLLKANAANRATASCIQDLADLEEALRKLRHELALAEKRLPSHGVLGNGSGSYTTWASVGHVCTLMLQALAHGTAAAQAVTAAATPRSSPPPLGAGSSRASPAPQVRPPTSGAVGTAPGGGAAAAAGAEHAEGRANDTPAPAAAAASGAAAAAAAAAASTDSPSGTSTPGGSASKQQPGGGSVASPGATILGVCSTGSNMPALATEGALLKLLGNKHVVVRAKEVLRVVPERYKAALARVLLSQMCAELKTTQASVVHILQILKGDWEATSPAPSALPKTWFNTAAILAAYSETLSANPNGGNGAAATAASTAKAGLASFSTTPILPAGPVATVNAPMDSHDGANGIADSGGSAAAAADGPQPATDRSGGDVEMTEAVQPTNQRGDVDASAARSGAEDAATSPHGPASAGTDAAAAEDADGASRGVAAAATEAESTDSATADVARAVHAAAAAAADDPRVTAAQTLEDVASSLCEAVTGAHGVGRVALLLRGEATGKYASASAYMPAALSINELMAQLDALACVGTALGTGARLRPAISGLLASPAMKELLGSGKVYVTTVIAAGALTRDLEIDAVIPQSLRQGYMAAVLTPLETGALLNERRAPQVLAYRNSITESSYYQVMDADALPYGVNVRFEDEQEAEGMGVVREWLSQIAADVFSPDRGLFVRGAADRRVVHPAPHSRLQEDYLGYMRFAGRIVGLALRANVPLGVVLSTGLFNYLTGRRATLRDLQQLDPQVCTTCENILSTPGTEALELFHVWHGQGGGGSEQEQEQELLPGGASLRVTDANKAAYVEMLAQHVVVTVVEEQCAAFLAGVQDTAHHLPDDTRLRRAFLSPLLLDDLNRITAGESSLDPEDWAEHTDVAGFESVEEQQSLGMFWQLVSEYGPEERQRLLQFWTAMTHLPSGGFKALNQRLQVMKLGPSVAAAQQGPNAIGAGEPPTRAGVPAPTAGTEAAAAAAAANGNGNGPAPDAAGPHSHRLDGDSLEADEPEQSDASDEPAEDGSGQAARQQAEQRQGSSAEPGGSGVAAAGGAGGAVGLQALRGASGREQDEPGGGSLAGPAGADTDVGAGVGPGAGLGPASARTDSAGRPIRSTDDEEIPYAEEEEEQGGVEEDGMDYGDEEDLDEDELFQRQLALALELSLQDMTPAQSQPHPAERNGPSSARGASAGGTAADSAGAEQAGGEQGGSSNGGGSGSGSGDGSQASEAPGAAATEEASQILGAEEEAGATGHDNGAAGGSTVAGTDTTGTGSMAAAAAAGAGAPGAPDDGEPSGPLHGSSLDLPPAPAGEDDGDGGTDMVSEPLPPPAGQHSPGHGLQQGTAAAAGAADVDGTTNSPSPEAAASDGGPAATAAAGNGSLPLPPPVGGDAPSEAMDAEAPDIGVPHNEMAAAGASTDAGTAGSGSGADAVESADGARAVEDATAAASTAFVSQQSEPEGGVEDRQQESGQQGWHQREEQQGGQGLQSAASENGHQPQPQPREEAEAAEPQTPQQQLQPRGLEQELEAAGSMEDPAEGSGGSGAAAAPSQSGTKALPLLPQARTCFLQLNLPVYDSIEDMRRAFAIALDNMSFGLH